MLSIEARAGKALVAPGAADRTDKNINATKLIEENIEDLKDRYLAEARLEKRGQTYSGAEVQRQLGLED